jgi:uncharacterized membrane protein (DUF485 family)
LYKYIGILTIIMLAFYLVFILIVVAAGVGASMGR